MVAEAYVLGAKWLFHELQTKKQQLLDSGVTQVDFIGTRNTSQQFQIDGMADGVVVMSTLMLLTPNALDDVTKQMQAYLRGAGDALRAATGIKGMQRITN